MMLAVVYSDTSCSLCHHTGNRVDSNWRTLSTDMLQITKTYSKYFIIAIIFWTLVIYITKGFKKNEKVIIITVIIYYLFLPESFQ